MSDLNLNKIPISATSDFSVPANIRAISPYRAGKPSSELAREFGLEPASIVKLASNENPLGFSPRVKQALIDYLSTSSLAELGRYPDPNAFDLKAVLAQHYDVEMANLTIGNGSNDLLEIISLAFLDEHSSAVYSEHAFVVYKLSTQARGARHLAVSTKGLGLDLERMYEAIEEDTRLVYIANPNNPTGTFHPRDDIIAFLDRVYASRGNKTLVVLDEAYNEYLDPELRFNSAELIKHYPNLVVLRTFSKAYGLAGLRVGFAIAQSEVTDYLNRVRQPFNVNTLAQIAAMVALEDEEFLAQSYQMNKAGKAYLSAEFERMGIAYVPSFTNFILFEMNEAPKVAEALLAKGVIVRPVVGDGLPNHLRVSIGTEEENQRFIAALKEVLA
ncbi:histidinol-phosphate transaminase [Oligella urethralis]|uniref:histidinol-phosphate transaminase n=1 Tax=Oligella urethralis TaxID=90245 RepID=UPI000A549DF8|nr:histidinol-phosphate transaminase [Oligella urethralis]